MEAPWLGRWSYLGLCDGEAVAGDDDDGLGLGHTPGDRRDGGLGVRRVLLDLAAARRPVGTRFKHATLCKPPMVGRVEARVLESRGHVLGSGVAAEEYGYDAAVHRLAHVLREEGGGR